MKPGEWDVIVVGPCAAGKSSLVACLRAQGWRARTVAQEHSYVPYMWQRHNPDVLLYLDLTLETVRRRRRRSWAQSTLDAQHDRLAHARRHCHLYLPTDGLTADGVAAQVLAFLQTFEPAHAPLPEPPPLIRAFQRDHDGPG